MLKASALSKILLGLTALLCVSLTGCYPDPYQNPGDWSMTGASRENTAVQVTDKAELFQGHGDNTSNGIAASAALDTALSGGTAAGLQKPPKEISATPGSN
jgi:hypothetical protein